MLASRPTADSTAPSATAERRGAGPNAGPADLLPHHAAELAASAIDPGVIAARGYRSIVDPADLAALGFAPYQCRAPGLLIPIHNTAGRVAGHHYKPDEPREDGRGRRFKYEAPAGSRPVLDVPPAVRRVLRDPTVPLGFTEAAKKADAAASRGLHVVSLGGVYGWRGTTPEGGKATLSDLDDIALDGRDVTIYFDSDLRTNPMVRQALDRFRDALARRGARVRIVFLPAGPAGAKVGLDDFFAAGHTPEDLAALEHEAADRVDRRAAGLVERDHRRPDALDPAALHGLAGDVVRNFDPHTEADPVATLVPTLAMFGNAVGRSPHLMVGDDRHGANLFAALVGDTAKARKGTSQAGPRRLFSIADPAWEDQRVQGGLSSGEGVIWAIRNPIEETRNGKLVIADPGVGDKRLFAVEEEFSSVLKAAQRQGNTISETVRRAWDSRGTLRTMTKNSPAVASNPHVSVLAHVTGAELRRTLSETDAASGFANRFLWVRVRRSKALPFPSRLPDAEAAALGERLRAALEFGRGVGAAAWRRTPARCGPGSIRPSRTGSRASSAPSSRAGRRSRSGSP